MKKRVLFMVGLLFGITTVTSQNLLNTTSWTVSSGSVYGYNQHGTTPENSRVLGENHIGSEVIMWQASPDSGGGQSGGFITFYKNIDYTKDYRLSVWVKKTNSNDGLTYFKCASHTGGASHLLKLDGTTVNYPAFWKGDLPHLDRWYLLVGFVHNSNYSSTINQGRIYDGVTGEEVQTITDFKFKTSAINLKLYSFLSGDTNLQDRQYMYAPTMYEVDDLEPTIDQLLSINESSKLLFVYDNAGSQKQRFYCEDIGCPVPTPPAGRNSRENSVVVQQKIENLEEKSIKTEDGSLESNVTFYPNPTKGILSIKLNSNSEITMSHSINIYNNIGMLVYERQSDSKNEMEIDISNLPVGIYLVHIHLSNGESVTKKIIKN